jgi:UDP-3-O-[3-hydroxymyristoyl] glucosamine N-acyltransferase
MRIKELALMVDGIVDGDAEVDITGISGVETAKQGDLTFAINDDRLADAEKSKTSCILTTKNARVSNKPLIRVNNPKLSFLIAYNAFHQLASKESFRHPSAVIANSAQLGKNVWVGPHVTIEEDVVIGDATVIESGCVIKKNTSIGNSCHIYPNVSIYESTTIKNNVILHGGVVIGSDGFGYVKESGKIYKFPQLGKVIIEDEVEIGANTTVDRGALCNTVIGFGSKIDNLCQIAHNVKLGKNVIIAAQSGIAGSTEIGDNVTISGQVAVTDNIKVGKNATIGGKSCVTSDVAEGTVVWGMPARPIAQAKREAAVLMWLTKNFSVFSKILKAHK